MIPPLALWLGAALSMPTLATVLPALTFYFPGGTLAAAALALLGACVCIAGGVELRRARTTLNPLRTAAVTSLVSQGVYRLSRNPMYLGLLLLLVALSVHLANVAAFGVLPLFVAYMDRFQIAPEEKALEAPFGTAFTRYMSRTRRWI